MDSIIPVLVLMCISTGLALVNKGRPIGLASSFISACIAILVFIVLLRRYLYPSSKSPSVVPAETPRSLNVLPGVGTNIDDPQTPGTGQQEGEWEDIGTIRQSSPKRRRPRPLPRHLPRRHSQRHFSRPRGLAPLRGPGFEFGEEEPDTPLNTGDASRLGRGHNEIVYGLNQDIDTLNRRVAKREERITLLEATLSVAAEQYSDDKLYKEATIAFLKDEIKRLETLVRERDGGDAALTQLTAEHADLVTRYDAIKSTEEQRKQDIEGLGKSISARKNEVKLLKEEVEKLKGEVKRLTEVIRRKDAEIATNLADRNRDVSSNFEMLNRNTELRAGLNEALVAVNKLEQTIRDIYARRDDIVQWLGNLAQNDEDIATEDVMTRLMQIDEVFRVDKK